MRTEVDGILVAAGELKAPLSTLRQLALGLEDLNAEDERMRAEMLSVSERAIRQVNDLAKIRRLEDGLFELEPVSVREVCDEVSREVAGIFQYQPREFSTRYRNREKLITANREMLKSVLSNFLLGAMHYSGEEFRAQLSTRDFQGKVQISVRDFGPALPMEVYRELKQGLLEQPAAIQMRPGTSGLGLYIAAKFSRAMGAKVGAVRHRDGTSFFIELPVSRQMRLFSEELGK